MTQAELFAALKTTGLPVAYGEFESTPQAPAPDPPFITYQFADSDDLMADNSNYMEISNYQVELYTTKKDPPREKLLQDKFKELGLPYGKIEARIEEEKLYQVIYSIQLIGG